MSITRNMPVFSSAFLLAGQATVNGVRRQLDRWVKSGRVVRLRRGVYAVSLPYRSAAPHPFLVANRLRKPSYVSLQSALSHYGTIPEEFAAPIQKINAVFAAEGYAKDVRLKDKGTVKSALIRFKDVLFELGLSPRQGQSLSIRIELDTNPPAGAKTATTVIRKFVALNLLHYDRPSLLAGKLHAILTRPYTKGRDLFNLVWYLADPNWPEPNFAFLNNALA